MATYYERHRAYLMKHQREYYLNHREYEKGKQREYGRENKRKVIGHYSNGTYKCAVCGFDNMAALQIDHIKGNGTKHKKEVGASNGGRPFYCWLIRNDYPSGFQVLCANCNWIKRFENNENRK